MNSVLPSSPIGRSGHSPPGRAWLRALPGCALSALLALSGLTGCLELQQEISLREDGSARLRLRYSVPAEWFETMRDGHDILQEWQTGRPPAAPRERLWLFNEALARHYFNRDGLELISYRVSEHRATASRQVDIEFEAADFARALRSGKLGDFTFETEPLESDEGGLRRRLRAEFPVPVGQDGLSEDELAMLSELLRDLRMELVVRTPSPIIETDGEKIDERTVRWQFAPSREPELLSLPSSIEVVY